MLVLLLGYWFLQSQKLSDVNEQVAAQNATNTQLQTQIDQLQQFQQLQVEAAAQQALLASAYAGEVSFSQMLMDLSRTIPSDAYLNAFNAALTAPVVGEVPTATPTTSFVGLLHGERRRGWLREPGELADAAWNPSRAGSTRGCRAPTETGPNTGLYAFTSGVDLTRGRAHASRPGG